MRPPERRPRHRVRAVSGLCAAALASASARAAEVTDVPAPLRADLHVGYSGSLEQVGLQESDAFVFNGDDIEFGDAIYGIRNTLRHDVGVRAEFTPYPGVVVTLGLPINASQRIAYPAAREMVYEPVSGDGSYERGQPIDATPVVSSGLRGAWLGVALVPLHETFDKGLPVSVRFDVAARTPGAGSSWYGPRRGDGAGAALRLGSAFSVRRGRGEPYVQLDYVREFPFTVPEVQGPDGDDIGSEQRAKLPDLLDARVGVEAIVAEAADKGLRVAFDVALRFGYRGPSEVISGFWLPDVLPSTLGASVNSGDFIALGGALALDVHLNKWVGARLGVDGQWLTPRRVESPYPVRTDMQAFQLGWNVALVGRIRTKSDPR